MADAEMTTDDSGGYKFDGLRAGTYSVEISGFEAGEVSFSSTSGAATVGVGETKVVTFDGTYVRTAGVQGQVSVDGEGLEGVTVTLKGDDVDRTEITNAAGQYAFSMLKSGTYQVGIINPDPEDYEFETTSKTATIATGETANVPFEGTLLRTAGIAGRVSVEGMGLDDVTVTLAGAAEATAMTANGGQYSFAGLAAGTYVLTIANPNEVAYTFDDANLSRNVVLADDQSAIENFEGTHTRTAQISGVLFIDEVMDDKMRNDGEPTITEALGPWLVSLADDDPAKMAVGGLLASAKVTLRGPDLNTVVPIDIQADGSFSTGESLMAGTYQLELPVNDEDVAAGLAAAGVAFVGGSMVKTVEAGGSATADFPFEIMKQTLTTGARMGAGVGDDAVRGLAVPGVKLALFARADMTGDPLDEQTTDDMGMATFNFDRDANTGPAGNDNIVFVKVMETGHDALMVSGNEFVEIVYESTDRLSTADADKEVATLVNVAAAFDFWVKSNEMARDGDEGLGGWQVQYCMPMAKTDDADEVVCEGDDAAFTTIMVGEGDDAEPITSDTTTATRGKASFATAVDPTMLPAMFYVRVTPVAVAEDGKRTSKQPDMGEKWEASGALMHTHTGLDLPPGEGDEMTDLGPIRITYTTQSITLGLHRELDDRTGYTDYIGLGSGDGRPTGHAKGEIKVRLMTSDDRGRLQQYVYDHDNDPETDDAKAEKAFTGGTVSFRYVDAKASITVVASAPSGMTIVPDDRSTREIDAHGDQLDDYPDGVIVGAFGDMSGARPDVWLCPLQRQTSDDPAEFCSTFAYKWQDGEIKGRVAGLQEDDEDVVVELEPVRSNDDYASDFEDDTTVDYNLAGPSPFSFPGVADGSYQVILVGVDGKWRTKKSEVVNIVHDEGTSGRVNDTGAATYSLAKDLSATQLRYAIQGFVGNDRDGSGGLSRRETRSGVTLNLHYASAAAKAPNAGKRKMLGPVMGEDGEAMTAETNGEGYYEFRGLRSDTVYVVQGVAESGAYRVVRGRGGLIAKRDDNMFDQAVVRAAVYDDEFPASDHVYPKWDHNTGASAATTNAADFALLFESAIVIGKAFDPSTEEAHQDTEIELRRCLTPPTQADPANPVVLNTGQDASFYQCGSLLPGADRIRVSVEDDGDWFKDGLLEGYYEVVPDLPPGFANSNSDGNHATSSTAAALGADEYYINQVATVTDGYRASSVLGTFHIVNHRASAGIDAPAAVVKNGSTTLASNGFVPFDVEAVSLTLTNATTSNGARLKVGQKYFTSGTASSWGVSPATNELKILVTSANGYNTSSELDPSGGAFSIHRDRDTRLKALAIDASGATSPDDQVLNRADLTAMSGFGTTEGLQSDFIAAVPGSSSANVILSNVSIHKHTSSLTLSAEALAEGGVQVSWDGTTATTHTINFDIADAVAQTISVTITLTDTGEGAADSGRSLNTRSYRITFSQPRGDR